MFDILVVDDDAHVRRLYSEVLSRDGYRVETVATGEKGIEFVNKREFALVVLDIELENEDGRDILKRLKSEHPQLPIILNTAYSVYKSDFNTWMADAYVLKSSDITPLRDKILELVGA